MPSVPGLSEAVAPGSRTAPADCLLPWLASHLSEVGALVLDIDGVLSVGGRATRGAAALLELLARRRVPYALLTNDGSNSVEQKVGLLEAAGLEVPPEALTSSGHVLRDVARERELVGELCFVAGRLGNPCHAEAAGIRVTRRLEELESCRGIIIGEEEFDWEPVINAAVNFLLARPQAPLIIPNPDLYFPTGSGGVRVAPGGMAALIRTVLRAHGTQVRPLMLGKPFPPIFRHGHRRLEARAGARLLRRRVLMVGDSLGADIRGGRSFGYRTALLLTGATTWESVSRARVRPELVFRAIQ
ncbi:MAG: HAD-IIA family hydrolase [Spirochaetales bacterium]|nr:HAD-IIA family hydrolase [Spirochaetales bacterium]